MPNAGFEGLDGGGMTIYYTQFDFFRDNVQQQPITAFPPVSMNTHSL